jgi:hypothetical protein
LPAAGRGKGSARHPAAGPRGGDLELPLPGQRLGDDGVEVVEFRPPVEEGAEIVPYRAIHEVFWRGLKNGDGRSLEAIRAATVARVVHFLPPPPKEDNEHIAKNHETLFAKDLPQRGVSSPALRLKFWKLQSRVLMRICKELDIEVMMPPARAVDEAGFLRPEFYANDATHGNWLYGERILLEIERLLRSSGGRPAK